MIIRSKNTLDLTAQQTAFTYPEVAGTNVIRWQNPAGFNASWAIQLGKTGAEQTEIVMLSSSTPSGTAGTLTGNDTYSHPTDTPIYAIKYDQLVFEVSTAGTAGTATPISSGTVSITPDSIYTVFDHTAGSSTYAYKTYFRNSVSGSTSIESDWITSGGFTFYSLGKMRQRVKDKLPDSSYIKDDLLIHDWLNEWYQRMNNALTDVNEGYALGTTSVAYSGTTELGTITDTNFRGQTKRVWFQDATGTYTATKMDSNSFSPIKIFVNTNPYYYFEGDSVIGRKPADGAGTFVIEYPKDQVVLVNDTDELPPPMHAYTKSFVDYATAQAKGKDSKPEEQQILEQKAETQLMKFKTDLTPRLRSGQTYIDIVESVTDDPNVW